MATLHGRPGDPLRNFRFRVSFFLPESIPVPASARRFNVPFQAISGLEETSRTFEWREMDDYAMPLLFPDGLEAPGDVVMVRGWDGSGVLQAWWERLYSARRLYNRAPSSDMRSNIQIDAMDAETGTEIEFQMTLLDAWPRTFSRGAFDAMNPGFLMETVGFAHEGIAVPGPGASDTVAATPRPPASLANAPGIGETIRALLQ